MNSVTDKLLMALSGTKEGFAALFLSDSVCRLRRVYESPFDSVFLSHFPNADKESIRALSLICALYLSHIHGGFPKSRFRAAVSYLRENVSMYSFNCNHYEVLYDRLSDADSVELPLLKDVGEPLPVQLKKDDIFEAFDFLTNAL